MKCEVSEVIKIKVGDTEIEINEEQAKALRDTLIDLFGEVGK